MSVDDVVVTVGIVVVDDDDAAVMLSHQPVSLKPELVIPDDIKDMFVRHEICASSYVMHHALHADYKQ